MTATEKLRHGDTLFLDGIRGIAALAVVISHLALWYFPEAHSGIRPEMTAVSPAAVWLFNSPVSFFYKGGFAVSLFFALSGLVLTSIGLKRRSDPAYLARATAKRYIRLGGPVAASILVCVLLKLAGAFHNSDLGIAAPLASAYDPAPNLWVATKSAIYGAMLYGDRSFNYVLWTISIEFYGSLMIYSLVGIFGASRKGVGRVAILIAALFMIQKGELVHYSMFFVGAWLATTNSSQSKRPPVISGIALLSGLYLGGYAANSAAYSSLVKVAYLSQSFGITLNWPIVFSSVGAALSLYGLLGLKQVHRLLTSKPLVWLGAISFSLYLTHSFVLTAIAGPVMHRFGVGSMSFGISTALVVGASLVFAHVFWKLFDLTSMKVADKLGQKLFDSGAITASCRPAPSNSSFKPNPFRGSA